MNKKLLPLGVVCLLAPTMQGALVNYNARSAWEAAVSLPSVLTNVGGVTGQNWVDFSTATYCPNTGCPDPNISIFSKAYTSGSSNNTLPGVMSMTNSIPGLTIEGYSSVVGGSTPRLTLYDKGAAPGGTPTTNWQIGGQNVNWVSTRSTASGATAKMRINLPTGTVGVALEIALACYISSGCTNGENVPGFITLNTSNGETKTLGDNTSTQAFTNNSSTVGEFTFFGFTTDQTSIAWIDLTPDSPGAVILARFTYVTALSSNNNSGPDPVPEPATWATLASAAALLATRHYRNRR